MASLSGNYTQPELPSDVFNSSDGDIVNWNGNAVKVNNAGNGTRDITDLGSWDGYQATQAAQQDQTNFQNLVDTNTKSVTDFLGNYKTDVANAQTTGNAKYNVPTFENLVTGLTSRISDLEYNSSNSGGGSVGNTGAGGFADAGQVDEALSSRYVPQLNAAEANLNTGAGLAATYVSQATEPDQAYASLLATNIATAMQGLTASQQTEMSGIIAKLNAGVALDQTEIQAGESYAATILDNANSITLENMKNQYTGIPSGNVTVNPSTGQIVNPYLLSTENGGIYG